MCKEDYNNPQRYMVDHPNNNIPPHIAALVGRGHIHNQCHPLGIINTKIKEYFTLEEDKGGPHFEFFLGEDPIVTTTQVSASNCCTNYKGC